MLKPSSVSHLDLNSECELYPKCCPYVTYLTKEFEGQEVKWHIQTSSDNSHVEQTQSEELQLYGWREREDREMEGGKQEVYR